MMMMMVIEGDLNFFVVYVRSMVSLGHMGMYAECQEWFRAGTYVREDGNVGFTIGKPDGFSGQTFKLEPEGELQHLRNVLIGQSNSSFMVEWPSGPSRKFQQQPDGSLLEIGDEQHRFRMGGIGGYKQLCIGGKKQFIGYHVALYNRHYRKFVQMTPDGSVGVLDDKGVDPTNLESFRAWERFQVVDAGDGKVALHCAFHNRFIKIDGDDVNGFGGPKGSDDLPADWASERFSLVDAGNGKYAFHNFHHNRFMRLVNLSVDAKGGRKDMDKLPPESEWTGERFQIVLHPRPASEQKGGEHVK
jgi:hypothetical protein